MPIERVKVSNCSIKIISLGEKCREARQPITMKRALTAFTKRLLGIFGFPSLRSVRLVLDAPSRKLGIPPILVF